MLRFILITLVHLITDMTTFSFFTNHSNRVVLCASTQQMAVYANRFVYKNTRRRKRSGRDVAHKQKEEGNSFTDDNLWSRLPCEFSKEA